jgi:hypothetical protein
MTIKTTRGRGFERGAGGVYTCTSCGHRTRYTGTQAVGSEVCEDCWELAGIFNAHQDGGDVTQYAAEIRARTARILMRRGALDGDARTLLALIADKAVQS